MDKNNSSKFDYIVRDPKGNEVLVTQEDIKSNDKALKKYAEMIYKKNNNN